MVTPLLSTSKAADDPLPVAGSTTTPFWLSPLMVIAAAIETSDS